MPRYRAAGWVMGILMCLGAAVRAAAPIIDESAGKPNEWGFRPPEAESSATNPPAFVWRPQRDAASYELQCARDPQFAQIELRAEGLRYDCYCPPELLEKGIWFWRFRFLDKAGQPSAWSKARSFSIGENSVAFPMPTREDLIGRIPKQHPRLFVRPEQLPQLRTLAQGDLRPQYEGLIAECERLCKDPPDTAEPPKYPPGTVELSEQWMKIWWSNRVYTIKVLNSAATLGFTQLLSGNQAYGRLAKRLLMDAAKWDPKGSTGYRYNDEAGMPYAYLFSRTYSFINDLLDDQEKAKCREVMTIRGREMYQHLCPRHIWQPYASHSNRAWHKLGEVGIAFLGEIPEAEEWVWFAMNVFYNVYPVWCDADGGWHEGTSYWESYIERFTYFADVMRVAMGVDAFKKPYFSKIGYYPLYLQPPGTPGGGFGDLVATRPSTANRLLMSALAAQAGNPHWQWYVDALGGPVHEGGYIGFIRGVLPKVPSRPPDDLPASRRFWGTGQAVLNTTLRSAKDNVELGFKSSPFGTQSHGYDANNSFFLYAYGERLLVPTGRRDIHGSDHHRNWMWETKSTNSITVDGQGQVKNSPSARGRIVGFQTSDWLDYVAGEASESYGGQLDRFTRHVLFIKPETIVIYDQLEAPKAATFEWLLHAPTPIVVKDQKDIQIANGAAGCHVSILWPGDLEVSVTDKFDPPPRERIKFTEWHLTARSKPARKMEFVTVIRPHRSGPPPVVAQKLVTTDRGRTLELGVGNGSVRIFIGERLAVEQLDRDGKTVQSTSVGGAH